jgi:guanylate kinase
MIVVLSGPSGVGKDTVIEAWRAVNPLVVRVVTATTRRPRPGETDGEDYHFMTVEEFNREVDSGAFLEHKCVHGNWYGTPGEDVDRLVAEGKTVVLKIDVQGAAEVKRLRPEAVRVFLMAPSLNVLRDRLAARGTDSPEEIERRLRNAMQEIEASRDYDHHVVNDDLDRAVQQLERIVAKVRA